MCIIFLKLSVCIINVKKYHIYINYLYINDVKSLHFMLEIHVKLCLNQI